MQAKLPALPRFFSCPICNTQNHKLHINNQAVKWVLKKSAENRKYLLTHQQLETTFYIIQFKSRCLPELSPYVKATLSQQIEYPTHNLMKLVLSDITADV